MKQGFIVLMMLVGFALLFAACGGGNASLVVSPKTATATAGGAAVGPFTASLSNSSGSISWALSPNIGTLSAPSGTSVTYTPPATLSQQAVVTLTASSGSLSNTATITVNPVSGGNPNTVACTIDAPTSAAYVPNSCNIKVGQAVKFTNISGHPLVKTGNNPDNPIPNTLNSGLNEQTVTFSKAGTYTFVCAFHSNMTGTITVTP